ncbi:protein LAZY 1 [Vigna radiata var. radiata]|uniref:Protein LAZY 1 n=1 Tax=Vigna radiata var. radiata TaxID=3916 RepID=A0A1S3V3I6_VIGRR|nr:protein LAZY 1 [Vigna radiata var. radiata]
MKLLGWMHRKFRQNTAQPFKHLLIGTCDDEHHYPNPKGSFGNYKHVKQSQKEQTTRKSFAAVDDDEYEEDSAGAMYELFHGFLAIGTLGSEQVVSDPSTTPTFAISVENITEKEDEVTENELKLINDELEKVLGADDESSCGRNSHVSNGRSSHGSIITLSGKPLLEGGGESNGNGSAVCPLKGYLFGSAIELSETTTVAVAKQKEHRTSLGELFQRTKLAEENIGGNNKDDNKRSEREADKSAMYLMKKKLKKRMLHTSSRSSSSATAAAQPVDSASAERKLHKILHMFHRKVHPENCTGAHRCDKYQKNESKKKTMNEVVHGEEVIMMHPKRALSKENIMRQYYKIQPNPFHFALGCEDSSDNKEHWIKTDADYLVLEL